MHSRFSTAIVAAVVISLAGIPNLIAASSKAGSPHVVGLGSRPAVGFVKVSAAGQEGQERIQFVRAQLQKWESVKIEDRHVQAVRAHLKRLLALHDISQLADMAEQRAALGAIGVTIGKRVAEQRVTVFLVSGGKERIVGTRPSFPDTATRLRPNAPEQPDGGGSAPRRDDPTTVEECDDYADVQMAIADEGAAEWQATADDIQGWIDENPDFRCPVALSNETPSTDEAEDITVDAFRSVCSDKAWTALTDAAGAVLGYLGMKTLMQSLTATLHAACNSAIAAYEAGQISWPAAEALVSAAIDAFVADAALGWIAVGICAAAAGYYAEEFIRCKMLITDPEELGELSFWRDVSEQLAALPIIAAQAPHLITRASLSW
jgi:hypothetical protein